MKKILSIMNHIAEKNDAKRPDSLTLSAWTRGIPTQRQAPASK